MSIVAAAVVAGLGACETSDVREEPLDPIVIVDQDGKEWNISQAVRFYGFEPGRFQFGLGAFAVPPIVDPTMAAAGDSGYPAPSDTFDVIGTAEAGEARAYRVDDLVGVEVVDDAIAGRAMAVVHRPLLGAPSVHTREIEGDTLTLSASGWVYDDQSILFDYETESMWYRFPGDVHLTCVAGSYFRSTLPAIASAVEAWNVWRSSHPATRFLLRPPPPP